VQAFVFLFQKPPDLVQQVEPSRSVSRNVTVPDGGCRTMPNPAPSVELLRAFCRKPRDEHFGGQE